MKVKATVYYTERGARAQKTITAERNSLNRILYDFLQQTGKSEYTYIRYVKCGLTRYDVNEAAWHYAMA